MLYCLVCSKNFFIRLLLSSCLLATNVENKVGKYELSTVSYISKKGTVYIIETVLDTQTGEVIKRRKIKASTYKLPYKDRKGKLITKE